MGGYSWLVAAAKAQALHGRRPFSLLLVGDSVDRKMCEALNNSRAAAPLHAAGVCICEKSPSRSAQPRVRCA
eukprot:4468334-Prymnesium_polylepis.1